MHGYLGTVPVEKAGHPLYGAFTQRDWAMHFIAEYGCLHAPEHKVWALDQVSRILMGTSVVVGQAKWASGRCEDRFWLVAPSKQYVQWREEVRLSGVAYDEGTAPEPGMTRAERRSSPMAPGAGLEPRWLPAREPAYS